MEMSDETHFGRACVTALGSTGPGRIQPQDRGLGRHSALLYGPAQRGRQPRDADIGSAHGDEPDRHQAQGQGRAGLQSWRRQAQGVGRRCHSGRDIQVQEPVSAGHASYL